MFGGGSSLKVNAGVDTGITKFDSDIIINGDIEIKDGSVTGTNKVNATQMKFLSKSVEGVAQESKVLVLDSNKSVKGINEINTEGNFIFNQYGENSLSKSLDFHKSRGSENSLEIAQINDTLGSVNFKAYGSIAYGTMTNTLTLNSSASNVDDYYNGSKIIILIQVHVE